MFPSDVSLALPTWLRKAYTISSVVTLDKQIKELLLRALFTNSYLFNVFKDKISLPFLIISDI